MNPEVLAPWRDLSIVWFVLWMMVFAAIPGVVFFLMVKYLRRFNRWLKTPLLNARVWALRIQYGTQRVSHDIADAVIRVQAESTRVSITTRGIINFLWGQ